MTSQPVVPTRREAFTLIEVLVVVAIIALLIAILMPSLGKAREQARSAVCLANLHRLGHAVVFYTEQYRVFPPFRLEKVRNPASGNIDADYVNRYGRKGPRWQWFFDYGVGPVINQTGVAAGSDDMTNEFFLCPSLTGPYERNIRNGAYGYNYQYLGNTRPLPGGADYTRWPVKEGLIKVSSRTVLVADSRGADLSHGQHSYSLDPPRLATEFGATAFGPKAGKDGTYGHSPVEMRHGTRGNVAFADGHATAMHLKQLGYSVNAEGVAIGSTPEAPQSGASNSLWNGRGGDDQMVP